MVTAIRMSQPQMNYAKAKALYDTIKARADAEKSPIHKASTRNEITSEEWASQTTDIEYKLGYWKAFDVLIEVEKSLVTWAKETMQTRRPQDYSRVRDAFEKPIYNKELRQKLIDICFRLDATTIK